MEESGYTFRRITRQYSSVRNTPWKCGATRMKNLRYSIHSVTYIHRANEGERKQYVFDPTTPSGGLWYKLKQVWNGKWRRHAKERQEEADSSREREREKKGVARVSSFWASNWNNGNWLTSNEYSIGLFEQWEKNIRRRACVDTTKDNLSHSFEWLPREYKREWREEEEGERVIGLGYWHSSVFDLWFWRIKAISKSRISLDRYNFLYNFSSFLF